MIQITIKLHKKITHITELIHYATFWIVYLIKQNTQQKKKTPLSISLQINVSLSVEALRSMMRDLGLDKLE